DNRDTQLHNVAIYRAKDGDNLFTFTPFPGSAKRSFESGEKGIPEGVWYFQCDVHPPMNGLVTAGEATAPASPPPSPPPATGGPSAPIDLIAKNTAFDAKTLTFPANTQVTINFRNEDLGVPHNWAMYKDNTGAQAFFNGPIFSGVAEQKYVFTSPGPGTYFFRCDVHPGMNGTATVA
ncbi:MAG: cupredoxin domain-containing protein, partial [Actinomycetota bacterium]